MERNIFGHMLRYAALPVGCALLLFYFGSHALFGTTGWFALDDLAATRTKLMAEHEELAQQKAELARSIALLDPRGADPDYADELIRRQLGVVRPDEVIVPLDD